MLNFMFFQNIENGSETPVQVITIAWKFLGRNGL